MIDECLLFSLKLDQSLIVFNKDRMVRNLGCERSLLSSKLDKGRQVTNDLIVLSAMERPAENNKDYDGWVPFVFRG